MAFLDIRSVSKSYRNHRALLDVSMQVPKGGIMGLLGPNGAGKTTLIRMINRITAPDSGSIWLDGRELGPEHARRIGYLPEERGLYKKMKIGEQLLYLARLRGLDSGQALQAAKHWMTRLEMQSWWNKKAEELSKGMQQQVQLVAALMHDPDLLILDEPFSGFDPVNAQLITEEILDLKKKGCTIIFSTHRMETVEDLCDHIALINRSKKILEGSKKQVKEQFKTNTFLVEHNGGFAINGSYELVSQTAVDESLFHSIIKMKEAKSPNELIRDLIQVTEVQSFQEEIPTMSEIFINLVKGGTNHE
jgi:ABC-2 type transport system ATP-binding protein